MFTRPQIRIKSSDVDKAMYLFTNTPRPWPSYPADRIEVVLKHYNRIPAGYLYSTFDTTTEELIFLGPPELEVPEFAEKIFITEKDMLDECNMRVGVPKDLLLPPPRTE